MQEIAGDRQDGASLTTGATASTLGLDMGALFARHASDCYELYGRHGNEQLVRMLKVAGYDVGFCRGEGPYLYDHNGTKYLDLLSGFGVFAIGRNHPAVRAALRSVLDSDLPNLIQMDAPRLAAILAERLLKEVPYLDKVLFANSGGEAVEAAMKFARASTGRSGIVYCDHAFHGVTYGALSINGENHFVATSGRFCPSASAFRSTIFPRSRMCWMAAMSPLSSWSRSRAKASMCQPTIISRVLPLFAAGMERC